MEITYKQFKEAELIIKKYENQVDIIRSKRLRQKFTFLYCKSTRDRVWLLKIKLSDLMYDYSKLDEKTKIDFEEYHTDLFERERKKLLELRLCL